MSKVKSRSHYDVAHLHPEQCPYQVSTSYTSYGFQDIARTKIYRSSSLQQGQIKVTLLRSTPTPPNPCPYQVSTSYTLWFPRYSPDQVLYRSSSLRQGQRSNQGHTMTLHTHYPQPMSSPSISFLHLTVSEI